MGYVFSILYLLLAGIAFVASCRQRQYENQKFLTMVYKWKSIKLLSMGLFLILVAINLQVRSNLCHGYCNF